MSEISKLQPNAIWKYFDEISHIPRPSKKEEKIIKYLFNFASEYNLEAEKDEVDNVVIRKAATPGMENATPVILQSHTDMVCEKNNDVDFNFDTDSIQTYIDGDWVKAKGTTLGGDDGIGVAGALAILSANNIKHGPLECFFTADEETGMTGAFGLQPGFLKGKILINLDSEDEGELFIGCAGGIDTMIEFEYKKEEIPQSWYSCKISVSGLNGGHSGDEIDKGLGNANKILNRFLRRLSEKTEFRLSNFDGGNLRNAIAREASAIISVSPHHKEQIRLALNIFTSEIQNEYLITEKALKLDMNTVENTGFAIDIETQNKLLQSIYACPHGVISMSQSIKNLVETSTNLASVKFKDDKIVIATSQRSSVDSALTDAATMVRTVFELAGANIKHSDGYPGWTPKLDSEILKITEKSYEKLFNKKPAVLAIHAGLECGLFLTKYPHLDMISFGPTIKGAHSPDERMNIPTVQKFWDLLVDVLENIK
ncbi:MAG: cytosol nonspecific dipeptidase [Bacteroidetes bacterium]|nr:MAG: cytosol nonspecific dipeptidase [Bacteroidota bacterium]